ncbi:unnamed protein product [Parascedosporium putredinis]|uniref:FAD-binding domain-containing protein n=1 Tax=Parascedosporium putredinis TaxID=1442378 RepID=A0A9P1H4S7_9PEZI|nr:unnamed protein product [Parascedosporium putredinis]CAI7997048.1 unnamed protein product [Parascedosporium putredinis]
MTEMLCNGGGVVDGDRGTILLVVGTGGFTHAAPILELGRILARRGLRIEFATHKGQQAWVEDPSYEFVSRVYTMGNPMDPDFEEAHYLQMQDSDPRRDYREYFAPKFRVDAFWASDYPFLTEIVDVCKPDMIVADFFVDAVRDIQYQTGIPVAMLWPQMPYGMASVSYIPGMAGFQIDALTSEHASLWTRLRAALRPLRALPAILPYLKFVRTMRRGAGVHYSLPVLSKPNYLALVNSFWGLETPKELPPLIAPVGPILSDTFPPMDEALAAFYAGHKRVVYVSFGTHVRLPTSIVEVFLQCLSMLMEEELIDGVVWAASEAQCNLFPQRETFGAANLSTKEMLRNADPHCVNEGCFHGRPMLILPFFFDQPLNALRLQEAGVGLALDKADISLAQTYPKARIILQDAQGTFAQNSKRMRHIARVASRRKELGADLIEEMLYDHRFSLLAPHEPGAGGAGRRGRPMHLQTADARMTITCIRAPGPALAHWLLKYGFTVTVVERSPGIRSGGQAIDFKGAVHDTVISRMGIKDTTVMAATFTGGDVEIRRGDLGRILYDLSASECEYRFGKSITALEESEDGVQVSFRSGATQRFDLVVGADGMHSNTRRLIFGPEASYVKNTGWFYALADLENPGGPWMYNEPGRMASIGGPKAPAFFVFQCDEEGLSSATPEKQRETLVSIYRDGGFKVPELLSALPNAGEFYMDSISRVDMKDFTKGRVVLLGDSAYGNTLGGFGTGLAVVGAYVLAGELALAGGDHEAAFANPRTNRGIRLRNLFFKYSFLFSALEKLTDRFATDIELKDYEKLIGI